MGLFTHPSIGQINGLQTALNLKADLNGAALTGVPTAPTAGGATNTTQIATTAFVQTALATINTTVTLTTNGTSGATTLVGNTLNVPTYTFNGLLPVFTAGSILFANGTTVAQDNANFFWDDTNNRLGIGTAAPAFTLDIVGGARFSGAVNVALSNGLVKTSSGALTLAVAGTDYQVPISITTTGTSGAATFIAGVLNIPQYAAGGGGGTTYSAGAGLTLTGTVFSVNNVLSIARISNLTTNGIVKTTTANGTLAIAVAGTDYQAPIALTTTGSSGAATFTAGTLNIPNHTLAGLGGIGAATTDTLTNKNLTSGTNVFPTFNQSTTGNAATATKLATARTINGVSFDGTANITVIAGITQALGDNTTNFATTAFVQTAVSANTAYFAVGTFTGAGSSVSPFTLGTSNVGVKGSATLAAGVRAITITGVSTASYAFVQPTNMSSAGSTVRYIAVCTANTVTITALNSGATTNTSDVSSFNYIVYP